MVEVVTLKPGYRQDLSFFMKKFPETVLSQVGMSTYWLHLDVAPSLFVRGTDGNRLPFLLSNFVVGKIASWDLGSKDIDLPILDGSFTYSGSNGSSYHVDEEESNESLIRVHDSYDNTNDGHISHVIIRHVTNVYGDGEYRGGSELDGAKGFDFFLGEFGFSRDLWYIDVVEEVSTLKATMASLELEKTGLLDKVDMLEYNVQKLKSDLNESSLRNTDLKESVVGRAGYEMMNTEFKIGLHETGLPL
ncbi:unnamed protein product [Lactuca saligna]|uniref:Uncharacterized protein n=1 Tax=Lactuca saligna TaxID=75948 RepID=A0AA35YKC0_LACSI|nr:unnamed protein product [Lactuca saligna]